MIIDIPFVYTARLLKHRNKIEKDYVILSTAQAEIQELGRNQVKRAAQISGTRRKNPTNLQEISNFEWDYYLLPNGNLCSPLELTLTHTSAYFSQPMHAQNLQEALDEWRVLCLHSKNNVIEDRYMPSVVKNPFITGDQPKRIPAQWEREQGDVIRWISDNKAETLAHLLHSLQGAAIINGTVYSESLGPYWRIEGQYERVELERGRMGWVTNQRVTSCPERMEAVSDRRVSVFSPNHLEAAMEAANKLDQRARGNVLKSGDINVFIAEPFERSEYQRGLFDAVNRYLKLLAHYVPGFPPYLIHTYADTKSVFLEMQAIGNLSLAEQEKLLDASIELQDQYLAHLGRSSIPDKKSPLSPYIESRNKEDIKGEEMDKVAFTLEDLDDLEQTGFNP